MSSPVPLRVREEGGRYQPQIQSYLFFSPIMMLGNLSLFSVSQEGKWNASLSSSLERGVWCCGVTMKDHRVPSLRR